MTFLEAVKLSRDEGVEVRPVGSKKKYKVREGKACCTPKPLLLYRWHPWETGGEWLVANDKRIEFFLGPWERVPEEGA